jgi:hypothetical protein
MSTITLKRGDTFRQAVVMYADLENETVEPITGWLIASQVRDKAGTLVADLTISNRADADGLFVISAESTEAWPVGVLSCDIQTTDASGLIRSTPNIALVVHEDVTRPA